MLDQGYSKRRAASELGINSQSLNAFIKEFGINWPVPLGGRPGTMPPLIGRSQKRVELIEAEYGMPILEVILQFAKDGESRASTAAILNLSRSTVERIVTNHPIPWPMRSNAARMAGNRSTPAIVAAARRNMAKARVQRWAQEQSA